MRLSKLASSHRPVCLPLSSLAQVSRVKRPDRVLNAHSQLEF